MAIKIMYECGPRVLEVRKLTRLSLEYDKDMGHYLLRIPKVKTNNPLRVVEISKILGKEIEEYTRRWLTYLFT